MISRNLNFGKYLFEHLTQGSSTSTPLAPAPYSVDRRFVEHTQESVKPLADLAVGSYLNLQEQALQDAWFLARTAVSYQHAFASVALLQIIHILREYFGSEHLS